MREARGGDEDVREKQGEMRKEAGSEVSVSLVQRLTGRKSLGVDTDN
jgi:hypothetical protein